jgi:putative phage-type endonuclease
MSFQKELEKTLHCFCKNISIEIQRQISVNTYCSILKDIWVLKHLSSCPSIEELESLVEKYLKKQTILSTLKAIPVIPQRSDEWLSIRSNMLTASDLAQSIGKGKFGSRNALLQKKAQALCKSLTASQGSEKSSEPGFASMLPLKWGTMFEPMISRVYSQRHGDIEIYDFGLLAHPNVKHFGASPDGITELGKMVEIKCPWKRKIEPGNVPEQYYLQIQGQLSVCGLEECDYIEIVMENIDTEQQYYEMVANDDTKEHGVIIELQLVTGQEVYEYSPPNLTPQQAYEWANKRAWEIIREQPDTNIMKIRPWKVQDSNQVTVKYDPELWSTLVPQIETFWKDVLDLKNKLETTEVASPSQKNIESSPAPSKRVKKLKYREEDETL